MNNKYDEGRLNLPFVGICTFGKYPYIENWDNITKFEKNQIFSEYIDLDENSLLLIEYFDIYIEYLKKNTFNSLLKGVIKLNF